MSLNLSLGMNISIIVLLVCDANETNRFTKYSSELSEVILNIMTNSNVFNSAQLKGLIVAI